MRRLIHSAVIASTALALGTAHAAACEKMEKVVAAWLPIMQTTAYYVALEEKLLNITAAGTVAVSFGSIGAPGAKGVLIRYDAQPAPAAPVAVTLNGGNQPLEICPGGMLVLFNPAPTAGITAMSLAVTAACQIRIWILG